MENERYAPDASASAIVNSSRYASDPVTISPDGRVTVTFARDAAAAPVGYNIRWRSARPSRRLATPPRSPLGEWHFEQARSKYLFPASAFPVWRSATSTARRPPVSDSALLFWS